MSVKSAIELLARKQDLSAGEMESALQEILTGTVETSDIIAFLSGLQDKGETVEELTAAVRVMLRYVDPIVVDRPHILDTCGTGGDRKGTFNISTLTAFAASASGITVAKHGNRSVSSSCGSADLLEALGVKISMDKALIKRCLEEIGIAFLFAPSLHPAMKHVMPARKQMARRTMFNILGPLINPARATNQLIGVYSKEWTAVLAQVLSNLGTSHVLVVHGEDGLDEVTTTAKTHVAEVSSGRLREYTISPEQFGIPLAEMSELAGGDLQQNVRIARSVLEGRRGAWRDIVVLNAGCAIYAADRADSVEEGMRMAQEAIDSGKALEKLELLKKYSQKGA